MNSSTLVNDIGDVIDFFKKAFSNNPGVQKAVTDFEAAGTTLQAQLPNLAADAANAALALIPGTIGEAAAPFADSLIEEAVKLLLAKTSNPAVSAARVSQAVQQPAEQAQG